jgi:hypothetical protein
MVKLMVKSMVELEVCWVAQALDGVLDAALLPVVAQVGQQPLDAAAAAAAAAGGRFE